MCSRVGKAPTNFLTNVQIEVKEDDPPTIKFLNVSRKTKGVSKQENVPLIAWHYTHGTGAKDEGGMGGVDTFGSHLVKATPKKRNYSWKRCVLVILKFAFSFIDVTFSACLHS
jgi:hypothetical protein